MHKLEGFLLAGKAWGLPGFVSNCISGHILRHILRHFLGHIPDTISAASPTSWLYNWWNEFILQKPSVLHALDCAHHYWQLPKIWNPNLELFRPNNQTQAKLSRKTRTKLRNTQIERRSNTLMSSTCLVERSCDNVLSPALLSENIRKQLQT